MVGKNIVEYLQGCKGSERDRTLPARHARAAAANDDEKWIHGKLRGAVSRSDDHVSRDAANFIASHDMKVERMSDGLRRLAATIPVGRPDLLYYWQSVARRVGELVAAGLRRTP